MRRLWVASALAVTIVTVGIVLAVTSIGGAATKRQAGYPAGGSWSGKVMGIPLKALGATTIVVVEPGGAGVFAAFGLKDYNSPAPGIHCLRPKGGPKNVPLLVPIWPANGPAIVSWDIFNSDCPFGWIDVRVYDPGTGFPTDDGGFLLYAP